MDEHADNSQQRKKRKEFYLRNGFHETGYYLMFHQILMEIVCNKDELDVSGFQELLNKMEIRNTTFQRCWTCRKRSSNDENNQMANQSITWSNSCIRICNRYYDWNSVVSFPSTVQSAYNYFTCGCFIYCNERYLCDRPSYCGYC